MRSTAIKGAALLTMTLALAACGSSKAPTAGPAMSAPAMSQSTSAPPMSQSMSAPAMSQSATTRTGTFGGLNDKHVAGTATVTNAQIALSGFSSDAGPDLHIYLANGTDEKAVAAGKEVGTPW
jgi:ABC-type oligopeptide transport system substrate-binding subunit